MDSPQKSALDRPPVRILIATLAVLPPFVLHQGLAQLLGESLPPALFFLPTILAVALWLGFRAGLATTAASAVLMDLWLFKPVNEWRILGLRVLEWRLQRGASLLALTVFILLGTLISLIAARYRASMRRLTAMETEHALRASENRFRKVLGESRDIFYRLNLKTGKYDYLSQSAETVLGYTEAEFNQMTAADTFSLLHPDDLTRVVEEIRETNRRGRAELEYRARARDGNFHWLSNLIFVEYDAGGVPIYHEGNIRDISSAKATQEALVRSASLASAGRMAAAIAHEINNPLTAVTNLLFLAQHSKELPEPVGNYLEQAEAELERIARITRRTLSFYRESSTPAQVSIDALLDSCIELFERQIRSLAARVVRDGDAGVEVRAFGGELRQVFSNLVSNSLDAIRQDGAIRIRVRCGTRPQDGEPCIRIAVADDGQGIAPEARTKIFEPFFTTKGTNGTGLGLWVSAQLVTKNGGRIRVRSSSSGQVRGTVFVVELPA